MSGFAAAARRGKRERKFTPTPKQFKIAKRRMLAALETRGGAVIAPSQGAALDFFCRTVHNRGHELGDYKKNGFRATLEVVLKQLLEGGEIIFDNGMLRVTYRFEVRQKRLHRDKFLHTRTA